MGLPGSHEEGHMEQSTIRKQHRNARDLAGIEGLPLYTFRHTCLTGWAASHMDPYTLAYCAGHSDFGTTRRYVHPETGGRRWKKPAKFGVGTNMGTMRSGTLQTRMGQERLSLMKRKV